MNGIFYQEAQGCSLSLKYHTTNVCMMMVQQVVVVHFCDLRTASTAFPTRFRYVSFLIHRQWVTFPGAWSFAVGLSRFCMRVNKAFSSFFSSPVPVMVLDPDKDSCARRVPLNHIFERSRTGFLWLTNIRKVDKYPQTKAIVFLVPPLLRLPHNRSKSVSIQVSSFSRKVAAFQNDL